MAKSNLDLEHELPATSDDDESTQNVAAGGESSAPDELQKLKAERDELRDRLARAQAEFDNARKRASKEQQEFREYAAADTIKSLLPVLDSFERALQVAFECGGVSQRRRFDLQAIAERAGETFVAAD